MSDIQHWTIEEYPAAVVDGIRGRKLPTSGGYFELRRFDGHRPSPLEDADYLELLAVCESQGLPVESLIRQGELNVLAEAFNLRPGYSGWKLGVIHMDSPLVNRMCANSEQERVSRKLWSEIEAGRVKPKWPGSMIEAEPHEIAARPTFLVLSAAELAAAGLPVPRPLSPAGIATTPAPSASAPAVALPERVAAPAEAVPMSGAGGNETPAQRRERLRQRVDHWKAQGVRDFTARVAAEEGVTEDRIRKILSKGKTKPATAKPKAKPRPPATFCSGLMTPAGRAR